MYLTQDINGKEKEISQNDTNHKTCKEVNSFFSSKVATKLTSNKSTKVSEVSVCNNYYGINIGQITSSNLFRNMFQPPYLIGSFRSHSELAKLW